MEVLNTADLLERRILHIEYGGDQFRYWHTMTFAVIATAELLIVS